MNIIEKITKWLTPKSKPGPDGIYDLVDVRNIGAIGTLAKQIYLLPDMAGIDKKWIIDSLHELTDEDSEQFIINYQKIGVGKNLYYAGKAERLVTHMKLIYPEVNFEGLKAVNNI